MSAVPFSICLAKSRGLLLLFGFLYLSFGKSKTTGSDLNSTFLGFGSGGGNDVVSSLGKVGIGGRVNFAGLIIALGGGLNSYLSCFDTPCFILLLFSSESSKSESDGKSGNESFLSVLIKVDGVT